MTINRTTKVTGKGQRYFIDKFIAMKHAEAIDGDYEVLDD